MVLLIIIILMIIKSIKSKIYRNNINNNINKDNKYILLDVLLCSIAEYFYELCRILTSP